ncbi:serine hydrolase [Natronoglycomyces albus]|uniref:Serine hydrolase n=1 Tax=Natronoglycomyces albus TaxID=2811108 RepID=A0A895XQR4_9ACTN|nr:serine hydrolase [Natronoglycomyces albus]QSB03898.1 serine hydrolase [Natronoglycomyces albus]
MRDHARLARWRMLFAAVLAVTLALTACSGGAESDDGDTGGDEPVAVDIPQTPVGEKLQWYLDKLESLPLEKEEAEQHFAQTFLDQVPVADLNPIMSDMRGTIVTDILDDEPSRLRAEAFHGTGDFHIIIEIDSDSKIETLLFLPPDDMDLPASPTSWDEVDARLDSIAADSENVGFLAADIDEGECQAVHESSAAIMQPVGSVFKIFVLHAVEQAVAAGDITWDDHIEITEDIRSLPSGELQDRQAGETVTVYQAAELMISISDNTATDMLIDLLGRDAVEAQVAAIAADADPNLPLIDTRVFFDLKLNDYPAALEAYVNSSSAEKEAFLDSFEALDTPADADILAWTAEPRAIDTLEWFFSPEDICAAYVAMVGESEEVNSAMSVHDGGLELAAEDWSTLWFKGGNEPGVYAHTHLGIDTDGDGYIVVAMVNNSTALLDEQTLTPELLSIATGSFEMMKSGS